MKHTGCPVKDNGDLSPLMSGACIDQSSQLKYTVEVVLQIALSNYFPSIFYVAFYCQRL